MTIITKRPYNLFFPGNFRTKYTNNFVLFPRPSPPQYSVIIYTRTTSPVVLLNENGIAIGTIANYYLSTKWTALIFRRTSQINNIRHFPRAVLLDTTTVLVDYNLPLSQHYSAGQFSPFLTE